MFLPGKVERLTQYKEFVFAYYCRTQNRITKLHSVDFKILNTTEINTISYKK